MVYQFVKEIQWILLTPTCIACGSKGIRTMDLCPSCRQTLVFNSSCCMRCAIPLELNAAGLCGSCLRRPPRFTASYCAFEYGYPIAQLVRALKYGHTLSHAQVLASLLAEYLQQRHNNEWPQCIVPVPLSTERYRQRGFNQAIELARVLESRLRI